MQTLKLVIKLSSILSMAILLNSCRTYKVDYHYSIDLVNMRCLRYPIIDKENLKYSSSEVVDLMECDGMFGVHRKDTGYSLTFIRDEKESCKNTKILKEEDAGHSKNSL